MAALTLAGGVLGDLQAGAGADQQHHPDACAVPMMVLTSRRANTRSTAMVGVGAVLRQVLHQAALEGGQALAGLRVGRGAEHVGQQELRRTPGIALDRPHHSG